MIKIYSILFIGVVAGFSSCTDLDVPPKSIATGNLVFTDPGSYRAFMAKLYSGLILTGQQGPSGDPDIRGIDEGESSYLRAYWKLQELPTDEAVISWNDKTIQSLHAHTWTAQDPFINAMYNRFYFQISFANEFIKETTEEKLNDRGVTDQLKAEVARYRAEARFLRALSYWHALDMFGAVPLITEDNSGGTETPGQSSKADVFSFIESELLTIESQLAEPKQGEFGRADKAAAWVLLAKLYLNAEVYIGESRYTECLTYCNKIIEGPYALDASYQSLFMIGNDQSQEIIFYILSDGQFTRTFGGTTFLVHASIGGSMTPADYGVIDGWAGLRTTKALVDLFTNGDEDSRAIFYTDGQVKEISSAPNIGFSEGYAVPKFQNVTPDGAAGSDGTYVDVDFPLFRLADVYLMYAEAVERGGSGGSEAQALEYINALRERAYGVNGGSITSEDLTLDFILDERARELFWEAHRRTDLIRFGIFTDSDSDSPKAIWPWKGDIAAGKETEAFRNLFPVPSAQIIANPKLEQNDGY